jgi:glyceraldehyde-3-phosphate dehydrogenase/erythrose-4-phosphate dehydrogenase
MKVGLIGFGKTGRAVVSVILKHPNYELEMVLCLLQSTSSTGKKDSISMKIFLNPL